MKTFKHALLAFALSLPAAAAEMIVIRNNKAEEKKLTKAELKEMLTGKTKFWKNGKAVQVVLGGEGSADSQWVAATVFGVGESAMITKMKQEVFKGELRKVVSCSGDDECAAQVKASEGGVGVVSAGAKLPAGVEAVAIE
jgi:ABC-type phosphate transport system substrate-binding protein